MKLDAKKLIHNWIDNNDEFVGVTTIPRFLDMVMLKLGTNAFNPYDVECPFINYEDAEQFAIDMLNEEYGDIITTFPLEVLYFYGYINAKHVFLVEDIFGKSDDYDFTDNIERYCGKFTPKMENLLVNKLGVKKLLN